MDIWDPGKITIFLVFFIPGFIAIQIYALLVPSDPRDFGKQLPEAIGYSAINYALFYWIVLATPPATPGRAVAEYIVTFLAPVSLPFLFLKLRGLAPILTVHPFSKPWDFVFGQGNTRWVIVHLKDGSKVGGWFGHRSFASSYPAAEQLYLEDVWKLGNDGAFIERVDRTRGMIINGSEISKLEFKA